MGAKQKYPPIAPDQGEFDLLKIQLSHDLGV